MTYVLCALSISFHIILVCSNYKSIYIYIASIGRRLIQGAQIISKDSEGQILLENAVGKLGAGLSNPGQIQTPPFSGKRKGATSNRQHTASYFRGYQVQFKQITLRTAVRPPTKFSRFDLVLIFLAEAFESMLPFL